MTDFTMEVMQPLETVRHLPRVVVYIPTFLAALVMFLWIAIIIFRKWFDRDSTAPGITPSWWNPLGAEQILQLRWDPKKMPVGEAVLHEFQYFHKLYGKEGIFRAFILFVPTVMISRATTMEPILTSNTLINKSLIYTFLDAWLGTGLLTGYGEKWRQRRRMLTPAFHFRILEDFLPVFNDHSREFTKNLERHEGQKAVDIVPLVTMATLDIICDTAMGVKIHAQENSGSAYVKALYVVGASIIERISKPWRWVDFLYNISADGRRYNHSLKILHDFTRKVIADRKAEILAMRTNQKVSLKDEDLGVKKRRPFLDLLLETHLKNPELLNLEGIREEVDTFMFEGHDTTAMGISWVLYLLAENPDAQAKVHQELDEIFGNDTERLITTEDLFRMKYIECCIKEAQRLYPSVPFIARRISEDTMVGGHKIKTGTIALLYIYGLHRDEEVFPDPERFDPERFLPENSVGRNPFAYVPFSAGPRNCIGQKFAQMELKVMVASTLRRFSLRSGLPRSQLHIVSELVTRSRDGLPLFIESRDGFKSN
ncbi:cytochrome P450 4V2-like [Tropilaelaps mercedesae]|uniref:Cytochrome P450 4V2-like n=1 Tax=Tropilaelaps mercedesae TaxID=418985 RepID=A0A1V9XC01_9ACAR|nr:cytochrome P450 4V2-like [Tropilaelaps mercedesae]